jgi:uncharacterized protein
MKVPAPLPVIASCESCGACCQVVSSPPFRRIFDGEGEDAWEKLRWERPELFAELLADSKTRHAAGGPFYGTPCFWYDPVKAQCRHYEHRPQACRAFELGGSDCRDSRRRAGIDRAR